MGLRRFCAVLTDLYPVAMGLGRTVFLYLRQLVIMYFGGPRIPWQTTVRTLQLLAPFVVLAAMSSANFYSTADRTKEQMVSTEWLKAHPSFYLAVRTVQTAYTMFLGACPLLYLVVYVQDPAPSSDTNERTWEAFTMNLLKWSTLISLLLSACSDACLMVVGLCVPWMMTFFGLAHLVRLVFLCLWLKGQRVFEEAGGELLPGPRSWTSPLPVCDGLAESGLGCVAPEHGSVGDAPRCCAAGSDGDAGGVVFDAHRQQGGSVGHAEHAAVPAVARLCDDRLAQARDHDVRASGHLLHGAGCLCSERRVCMPLSSHLVSSCVLVHFT